MYAVIGANGYLGAYTIKAILEKTEEHVVATARSLTQVRPCERVDWRICNVQFRDSVKNLLEELRQYKPLKIIYLAAYHHPDLVEKNRRLAWDINVTSLSDFINEAYFADCIYYISTDCVYGNSIDKYHFKETDDLNPVNTYGRNKCAAESIVVYSGRNVVRFPFLISPSQTYKKHFYDEIVETLQKNESIEMYIDSYRSSLGFDRASELLVDLIETNRSNQIVNICGDQDLSKYDIGLLIAKRENLNADLVVPISAKKSDTWNRTNRALNTLMDNTLLKQILNLKYIDVFDAPTPI